MRLLNFFPSRELGNTRNIYASNLKQLHATIPNLDNLIKRLACQEKDIYESYGETGLVPPFASKFRKDKNFDLLAVANEDGDVILIDTSKDENIVKSFTAHHNAIYDICWLPDNYHLITVSGDQRACLWDMNTLKNIGTFKRHMGSIKSVDVCPNDNAMFATGSRDGTICVWDVRDNTYGNAVYKPSIQIQSAHSRKVTNKSKFPFNKKLSNSVSAVAFQDSINLASTGSTDSAVKIWDMRRTYLSNHNPSPRYQMKYKDDKAHGYGFTSLVFDSNFKKLYASSTANKILMFNCHTYADAETVYDGFKCNTYYIKLSLSADDQYLACGSSSNKAYVWKVNLPGYPKWEFPGHSSEVTTVAWGPHDVTKLVTCGDDNRILIWRTINHENIEQLNKSLFTASKYKFMTSPSNSVLSDSPPKTTQNHSPKTPVMKTIKSFFQPLSSPYDSQLINETSMTDNCGENLVTSVTSPPNPILSDSPPKTTQNHSPKTPVMKTIKSFFQPLSSPDDSQLINETSMTHNCSENLVPPVQVLSPSENMNPNIDPSPSIGIPSHSKSHGKENKLGSSPKDTSFGQLKRKTLTTPDIQRNSKRGRRNSNAKKKNQNSEGDIRNYFTSSLSPKE